MVISDNVKCNGFIVSQIVLSSALSYVDLCHYEIARLSSLAVVTSSKSSANASGNLGIDTDASILRTAFDMMAPSVKIKMDHCDISNDSINDRCENIKESDNNDILIRDAAAFIDEHSNPMQLLWYLHKELMLLDIQFIFQSEMTEIKVGGETIATNNSSAIRDDFRVIMVATPEGSKVVIMDSTEVAEHGNDFDTYCQMQEESVKNKSTICDAISNRPPVSIPSNILRYVVHESNTSGDGVSLKPSHYLGSVHVHRSQIPQEDNDCTHNSLLLKRIYDVAVNIGCNSGNNSVRGCSGTINNNGIEELVAEWFNLLSTAPEANRITINVHESATALTSISNSDSSSSSPSPSSSSSSSSPVTPKTTISSPTKSGNFGSAFTPLSFILSTLSACRNNVTHYKEGCSGGIDGDTRSNATIDNEHVSHQSFSCHPAWVDYLTHLCEATRKRRKAAAKRLLKWTNRHRGGSISEVRALEEIRSLCNERRVLKS